MLNRLIDVHAHLTDERLAPEHTEVLARARSAGLVAVVNAGTDILTSRAAVALAEEDRMCWALAGVHPHDALSWTNETTLPALRDLLQHPRCLGLGECGLDYHYDFSPRDVQRQVFLQQWHLAVELGVPLVIHLREAFSDFFSLIDGLPQPNRVLLHCFSGDKIIAERAIDLGFHFSFGGALTFTKAETIVEACKVIPVDRLHLETDCPYMTPKPFRGRRNEPSYLPYSLAAMATIKKLQEQELADLLFDNARRFFGARFTPSCSS